MLNNKLWEQTMDNFQLLSEEQMELDSELFESMSKRDHAGSEFIHLPEDQIPKEYQLPIGKIKNQGSTGSCTGFAATACIELLAFLETGQWYDLSEQFAYSQNKLKDPWRGVWYSGSSTTTAGTVLRDVGVCHENLCPYREAEYVKATQTMLDDAEKRQVKEIHYLRKIRSDIKQAIAQKMPVLMGFKMFTGFRKPTKGKVLSAGSSKRGGHAVMIFGYDEKGAWIKNSWGTSYGLHGTVHVPWDILEKYMRTVIAVQGIQRPWESKVPPKTKIVYKRRKTWFGKLTSWFRQIF